MAWRIQVAKKELEMRTFLRYAFLISVSLAEGSIPSRVSVRVVQAHVDDT